MKNSLHYSAYLAQNGEDDNGNQQTDTVNELHNKILQHDMTKR